MKIKIISISLLVGFITAIHLLYHSHEIEFHVLHQQLFIIPLILASFWFGIGLGVITAILISLLYGFLIVFRTHDDMGQLLVMTQICLYFFVALLVGWFSDRLQKKQSKLLQNERSIALGKAASALIFEIQDIVRQMEYIYQKAGEKGNSSKTDDMLSEINRLKRLLEALNQFKPLAEVALFHDLNDLILQRLPIYHRSAETKRISVKVDLDKDGCPSMVTGEPIARIIDSLVDNAIDFSGRGQSIFLRSKRKGDFCILEVEDSGPGVSKENEAKLFTIFFTTKPDGYGLSLSSGRKAIRDLGGDLTYRSSEKSGSIFTMKIPRESPQDNIQEHVRMFLPKSGATSA